MTASATASALPVDALVDLVRAQTGVTRELAGVETRLNGFSTKTATEFVTLRFEGGDAIELFVKSAAGPGEAAVYRALGGHPAFAAPRCLGTVGDEAYLVLAAVGGWDLRHQDLDAWETAAAALGSMQAAFHRDAAALEALPRRVESEYVDAAAEALDAARRADTRGAGALAPVVSGYTDVARALVDLPHTLVHGDLAPKNVLVSAGEAVFVDWEWTHAGPGATDLADLVNGLDRAATDRLVAAYVAEARGSALPDDDDAIAAALDVTRLERVIYRIRRSGAWGVEPTAVRAWCDEAARLHAGL